MSAAHPEWVAAMRDWIAWVLYVLAAGAMLVWMLGMWSVIDIYRSY